MNRLEQHQRWATVWLLVFFTVLSATARGTTPMDEAGRPLRSIAERVTAGEEDIIEQYGNISLVNFGGHFSESLLAAQGAKLASIEDYDVRVSYMADYVDVKDRFEEYTSEGILDHIKEPYRNVSGEITQADLDEHMQRKSTLIGEHFKTWFNANSIHIAYMALMFLNSDGGTEYKLNRYLMFGGNVVRVDRIKAKQVRSLVGFDISAENADPYLQDYIDELYRAMVDRNYAITGSVKYDGVQYLNNDTIFIDDRQDGIVDAYSLNAPADLEFGVNERDLGQVGEIRWTEVSEIPDYVNMLSQQTGTTNTARFHWTHYQSLSRIDVDYGDGRSTVIHVLPVNMKIVPSNSIYEVNEGNSLSITVKNNHIDFYLPPNAGVLLNKSGYPDGWSGQLEYGMSPTFDISDINHNCTSFKIRGRLFHAGSANFITDIISDPIRVVCPFDFELKATTIGVDDVAQRYENKATVNDTLWYVQDEFRGTRDVEFTLTGNPSENRFFGRSQTPNDNSDDEPFYSGYWDGFQVLGDFVSRDQDYSDFNGKVINTKKYGSSYFPNKNPIYLEDAVASMFGKFLDNQINPSENSFGGYPPLVQRPWSQETHYESIYVDAFEERKGGVTLGFVHENKKTLKLGVLASTEKLTTITDKLNTFGTKLRNTLKIKKGPGAGIEWKSKYKAKVDFYNKEDFSTRFYDNTATVEIGSGGELKVTVSPLPIPFLTYTIPGIGGIAPYASGAIGFDTGLKFEFKKRFNEEIAALDFYNFSGFVKVPITLEFGVKAVLLPNIERIIVELKGGAKLQVQNTLVLDPNYGEKPMLQTSFKSVLKPLILFATGVIKYKPAGGNYAELFDVSYEYEITQAYTLHEGPIF